MTPPTGLLLFAHGARDPRWAEPFQEVSRRVQVLRPGVPVHLAFLECMSPSLPEACTALAAAGCTHIDVVPLFLGAGGHVRKDLPALLDAVRAQHGQLTLQLHRSIGEASGVMQAMAEAAAASLAGSAAPPAPASP